MHLNAVVSFQDKPLNKNCLHYEFIVHFLLKTLGNNIQDDCSNNDSFKSVFSERVYSYRRNICISYHRHDKQSVYPLYALVMHPRYKNFHCKTLKLILKFVKYMTEWVEKHKVIISVKISFFQM